MTLPAQFTAFFVQLVAWFNRHPVAIRLAIVIAMLLALTVWSYSVTYASPLGSGGGGCC